MLKLGSEEQVGWLCAPVFTWLVCRNISDDSVKLFSFFLESTNPFCFPASNVLNVLMIFFLSESGWFCFPPSDVLFDCVSIKRSSIYFPPLHVLSQWPFQSYVAIFALHLHNVLFVWTMFAFHTHHVLFVFFLVLFFVYKRPKSLFRNNVYAFVFHFAEMFVKLCLFLLFTTDFFPAIYVTNILWNSVLHGCHLNKITISHTALVFCANMSVNVYLRNVFKSREQ